MHDETVKPYEVPEVALNQPNDQHARDDLSGVSTCDADCNMCVRDRMVSRRLRNEALWGIALISAGMLAVFAVVRIYS